MPSQTAARYERFAALEARGVSPLYEEWAAGVADDPDVLALIDGLPRPKRQPNLVFAAARLAGAPLGEYPQFREWLLEHWAAVEPVIQARMTQTNEAARCAVLLPIRVFSSSHPCGLSAYDDCKRCLPEHLGIWKDTCDLIKLCPFSHDYESPRLIVDCSRRCHGCSEQGFDLLVGNWFGGELTYALSVVDVLKNCIGSTA